MTNSTRAAAAEARHIVNNSDIRANSNGDPPKASSRANRLTCLLLISCFLPSCSADAESGERTAETSSAIVYIPSSEQTFNSVLVPQEVGYNKQREVWDEEKPVPGEDANALAGWSWLRSYAQQATVALMNVAEIECADCSPTDDPDSVVFAHAKPLQGTNPDLRLANDQPFLEQRTASYCSGTLIDDNLILTAGHCIRDKGQHLTEYTTELADEGTTCSGPSQGKLSNLRVVFNYFNDGPGGKPRVSRSKDVFRASEFAWTAQTLGDFAILQLVDATGNPIPTVRPRFQPAPLRNANTPSSTRLLQIGQPLAKIGAPFGIPLKISASKEGVVQPREYNPASTFTDGFTYYSRLDMFGGDSGGGIYELDTYSLVGAVYNGQLFHVNLICPTANPPSICLDACGTPWSAAHMADYTAEAFLTESGGRLMYSPMSQPDKERAIKAYQALGLQIGTRQENNVDVPDIGLAPNPPGGDAQTAYTIDLFRLMFCGEEYATARRPDDSQLSSETRTALDDYFSLSEGRMCPSCDVVPDSGDTSKHWLVIRNTALCNDKVDQTEYMNLPEVDVSPGREVTLSGDTTGKESLRYVWEDSNETGARCYDDPAGGDVGYRMSIARPTILYADTFGRDPSLSSTAYNFDTILAAYRVRNAGTASETWEFQGCWDDTTCGSPWTSQSQGMFFFEPGDYALLVTGWGGASGAFRLHLQALPASSHGEVLQLQPTVDGWYQQSGVVRSTLGETSNVDVPNCQSKETGRAPEYEFVAMSCPMASEESGFTTISQQTDFDTVLALLQGNQTVPGGGACNDDHFLTGFSLPWPKSSVQSLLLTSTSSGAGVRALVVDGYSSVSQGTFDLFFRIPYILAQPLEGTP